MALEDLTGPSKFLGALVVTNPVASDDRREGDDHLRGIKNVIKNTLPSLNGAWPVAISGGRVRLGMALDAPDGVFALPAYGFQSQAGMGMYRGGANALALVTGGPNNLVIADSGYKFGPSNALVALDAGTYTPVVTNGANVASSAPSANANWIRIGNVVTVSMFLTIDPTAASVVTALNVSLPVASALTASSQLNGSAVRNGLTTLPTLASTVIGDAANDNAFIQFLNDADVAARNWCVTFQYLVF